MKTWMRRMVLMVVLLPAVGLAQQKPAEAPPAAEPPPAAESAKSASAKQKPAEDQQGEKSIRKPVQWPKTYDPRTLKPIRLFMTREEVLALWGEPEKYLFSIVEFEPLRVTRKYFSREEYAAAVRAHGLPWDVYYRKVGSLPFEIQITYGGDGRQDPEHPEIRIFTIDYLMPQPVPAFRLLQELPEVAELCRSGCGIYGDSYTEVPHLVVYPPIRTLGQRIEASRMARLWMPEEYKKRGQLAWTPVLKLFLQRRLLDEEQKAEAVDWFETPIEAISFILERPVPMGNIFKLGSFRP